MNEHPSGLTDGLHAPATLGPALPSAPDLIGMSLADACEVAAWADARVDATTVSRSRAPWGVVIAQSPSPGVCLRPRWQIHVLVAVPPLVHDASGAESE